MTTIVRALFRDRPGTRDISWETRFLPDKVVNSSQARTTGSAEGEDGPGTDARAVPPREEAACCVAASGPSVDPATLLVPARVSGMIGSSGKVGKSVNSVGKRIR